MLIPVISSSSRTLAGQPSCISGLSYPSPEHLRGKIVEELTAELRPVSHNNCFIKWAEKILEPVRTDGQTVQEHKESREAITRSLAGDLEYYREQMEIVEKAIKNMLPFFNCTLMTILGVDVTTAANLLAEIGDISRFPDANKLAKFAGICPINFSSAGKERICARSRETGDYRRFFTFW